MNGRIRLSAVFLALVLIAAACGAFNPFVGKWKSGVFELEFKSDKTFKLDIGHVVSVNLEGNYGYDGQTLTLDIQGDKDVAFYYTFKDGKKGLVLEPQSDFKYIKTKIGFTKQ